MTAVADWTPTTGVAVAFLAGLLVGAVGLAWVWSRRFPAPAPLWPAGARQRAVRQLADSVPRKPLPDGVEMHPWFVADDVPAAVARRMGWPA